MDHPRERAAKQIGVSYVDLDGDIGIICSGAGLGMATMDIVGQRLQPANFLETGGVPLNCVFHDGDLIITDFGDITEVTSEAPMDGRLWRVAVGVKGMPLFRGAIARA
jgi:hypothetical protein